MSLSQDFFEIRRILAEQDGKSMERLFQADTNCRDCRLGRSQNLFRLGDIKIRCQPVLETGLCQVDNFLLRPDSEILPQPLQPTGGSGRRHRSPSLH